MNKEYFDKLDNFLDSIREQDKDKIKNLAEVLDLDLELLAKLFLEIVSELRVNNTKSNIQTRKDNLIVEDLLKNDILKIKKEESKKNQEKDIYPGLYKTKKEFKKNSFQIFVKEELSDEENSKIVKKEENDLFVEEILSSEESSKIGNILDNIFEEKEFKESNFQIFVKEEFSDEENSKIEENISKEEIKEEEDLFLKETLSSEENSKIVKIVDDILEKEEIKEEEIKEEEIKEEKDLFVKETLSPEENSKIVKIVDDILEKEEIKEEEIKEEEDLFLKETLSSEENYKIVKIVDDILEKEENKEEEIKENTFQDFVKEEEIVTQNSNKLNVSERLKLLLKNIDKYRQISKIHKMENVFVNYLKSSKLSNKKLYKNFTLNKDLTQHFILDGPKYLKDEDDSFEDNSLEHTSLFNQEITFVDGKKKKNPTHEDLLENILNYRYKPKSHKKESVFINLKIDNLSQKNSIPFSKLKPKTEKLDSILDENTKNKTEKQDSILNEKTKNKTENIKNQTEDTSYNSLSTKSKNFIEDKNYIDKKEDNNLENILDNILKYKHENKTHKSKEIKFKLSIKLDVKIKKVQQKEIMEDVSLKSIEQKKSLSEKINRYKKGPKTHKKETTLVELKLISKKSKKEIKIDKKIDKKTEENNLSKRERKISKLNSLLKAIELYRGE